MIYKKKRHGIKITSTTPFILKGEYEDLTKCEKCGKRLCTHDEWGTKECNPCQLSPGEFYEHIEALQEDWGV